MGAPKPKGPSAAELNAQATEAAKLEKERITAERAAERERQSRISSLQASRRGSTGRSSLITTSELGVKSNLGSN
jgi:hypothetical protein